MHDEEENVVGDEFDMDHEPEEMDDLADLETIEEYEEDDPDNHYH